MSNVRELKVSAGRPLGRVGEGFRFWPEVILTVLAISALLAIPTQYYSDLSDAGQLALILVIPSFLAMFVFGFAWLWRVVRASFYDSGLPW
jgi:hypothetical protein